MSSSVSTVAAKHGNVLVLLNTLYTSGFASMSPTIPMLTSKTMHTLYALSFLVYAMNCVYNWLHAYCILNGYLTSFPLRLWFVVAVVVVVVTGTMLCVLLVMLCVENAFAHRLNVMPYKIGFVVIWEALLEWVHSFNNFRVAFLFMALHDIPITAVNFFLVASCRCAGPQVLYWPLLISSLSVSASLVWRLVMLYFAYRRLIFPPRKSTTTTVCNGGAALSSRGSSFRGGRLGVPTLLFDEGPRLDEYDELWPVRWSLVRVYGAYPLPDAAKRTYYFSDDGVGGSALPAAARHRCVHACCFVFVRVFDACVTLARRTACAMLALLGYAACCAVGCAPCIHFYTCRRNSFAHRHKCAKTFVRRFTFAFHYVMFGFSLLCVLAFLALNLLLVTSVHVLAANNFPPEINKVCLSIDPKRRVVQPLLHSVSPYEFVRELWTNHKLSDRTTNRSFVSLERLLQPHRSDAAHLQQCKSIWEGGELGVARRAAGPWQTRIPLGDGKLLAISTHFISSYADRQAPKHTLFYDYALLAPSSGEPVASMAKGGPPRVESRRIRCLKRDHSEWHFLGSFKPLGFPYFLACLSTIRLRRADMIDCESLVEYGP